MSAVESVITTRVIRLGVRAVKSFTMMQYFTQLGWTIPIIYHHKGSVSPSKSVSVFGNCQKLAPNCVLTFSLHRSVPIPKLAKFVNFRVLI